MAFGSFFLIENLKGNHPVTGNCLFWCTSRALTYDGDFEVLGGLSGGVPGDDP